MRLSGLGALESFVERSRAQKFDRAVHGDRLGKSERFLYILALEQCTRTTWASSLPWRVTISF